MSLSSWLGLYGPDGWAEGFSTKNFLHRLFLLVFVCERKDLVDLNSLSHAGQYHCWFILAKLGVFPLVRRCDYPGGRQRMAV